MKIQIARNELLNALQSVIGVVERRQTLPVLGNFLLEVSDDTLTVVGTDLEMELIGKAKVQNLAPGRTTIPARKLFDICRGLPEGAEISLEATGDKVTLRSGKSRFTLASLKADEFPSMGQGSDGVSLTLKAADMKQLLDRTLFAMAQQDVRYYLNGLLIDVSPKRIRAVATDGHRLAFSEIVVETGATESMQVILPRKSIVELSKLLGNTAENVTLLLSASQASIEINNVRLTTKVIDGRFPDYERVIPENSDKKLTADRETLRRALARTAILSNEKFRGVRLLLEEGVLKLQTHNPEHEEAEEEIEIAYTGSSVEIGFNVNYLLDALGAMTSQQVSLEMKNAESSGLLHETGDLSSKYVIMPMRL